MCSSRYAYYRKATRGHNTLTFNERGGFDPDDAAASDQAVNIVSPLLLPAEAGDGDAHSPNNGRRMDTLDDGATAAGAMKLKRFVSVNLTNAYSGQLSSSPSAGGGDGGGSVIRSFALDNAMKVSKNGLFEPFVYRSEHFTKTGLGQT